MWGIYGQGLFNNSSIYQNYGYSLPYINNFMQPYSIFGNSMSFSQNGSIFNSLLGILFNTILGNSFNQGTSYFGNSGNNSAISNYIINNYGNIGSINITEQNNQTNVEDSPAATVVVEQTAVQSSPSLTPVTIDQETVEITPKQPESPVIVEEIVVESQPMVFEGGGGDGGDGGGGDGDPLVFDIYIDGDGIKTSDKIVKFDLNGDGLLDKINDVTGGVLAFDKNNDGIVGEDGSELFGNFTDLDGDGKSDGYKDGFEALKVLGLKQGLINGTTDMQFDANDIAKLEKEYGLMMKTNGYNSQAQYLLGIGISEINFGSGEIKENKDDNGNIIVTQNGSTFLFNAQEREYADVWHI